MMEPTLSSSYDFQGLVEKKSCLQAAPDHSSLMQHKLAKLPKNPAFILVTPSAAYQVLAVSTNAFGGQGPAIETLRVARKVCVLIKPHRDGGGLLVYRQQQHTDKCDSENSSSNHIGLLHHPKHELQDFEAIAPADHRNNVLTQFVSSKILSKAARCCCAS